MKKLLAIALVFIASSFCTPSSSSYFATTWAGTAANQGVTIRAMNDLWNTYGNANGSFCAWQEACPTTSSTSLQLMSRSYLGTNYYIDYADGSSFFPSGPYLISNSKSSSQIIVKRDIGFRIFVRRSNSTSDCTGFGTDFELFFNSDFTKAYTNFAQTTLFNGGGLTYVLLNLYINDNYAYCTIDASGNITSLIQTTC